MSLFFFAYQHLIFRINFLGYSALEKLLPVLFFTSRYKRLSKCFELLWRGPLTTSHPLFLRLIRKDTLKINYRIRKKMILSPLIRSTTFSLSLEWFILSVLICVHVLLIKFSYLIIILIKIPFTKEIVHIIIQKLFLFERKLY